MMKLNLKYIYTRLRRVKPVDLLNLWKLPVALMGAPFYRHLHPHLWIISEAPASAHDNGYWFFRYLREQHPEQECVYAIKTDSPERQKVSQLGKTVAHGSLKHWIMYLAAEKSASTQKAGNPNAAIFYALEVSGILRNKRMFLQHGVIANQSNWLHYSRTRFTRFICGARPEAEYVGTQFGYPQGTVVYTGLARFDSLHQGTEPSNTVLIMPSWREWIADEDGRMETVEGTSKVTKTQYFRAWNEFLRSPKLAEIADRYKVGFVFYPHHEMHKYLRFFPKSNDYLKVLSGKNAQVQSLLKTAKILITDYSSVFFDMAYMKKPTLFYQFDEDKFRREQYGEGYFDYHHSAFGSWHNNRESLLAGLERALLSDGKVNNRFRAEHQRYFPLYDDQNCDRIYKELVKM